jgi:dTMP kinase
MANGQLVAIEGPKGVGKTALCAELTKRLDAPMRERVIITKEPTPAFDLESEQILRGVSLAAAIAADRQMHVAEVLQPAMAQGKLVFCDRYILSSYVFHVSDGVSPSIVAELNQAFPRPVLQVILRASPGEIRTRLGLRGGPTRLQAVDSSGELALYLRYAMLMESQGVTYETWDNSDLGAQRDVVNRLLDLAACA